MTSLEYVKFHCRKALDTPLRVGSLKVLGLHVHTIVDSFLKDIGIMFLPILDSFLKEFETMSSPILESFLKALEPMSLPILESIYLERIYSPPILTKKIKKSVVFNTLISFIDWNI